MASRTKQVKNSPVFGCHVLPKACEGGDVQVLPIAESSLPKHMKAPHTSRPPDVSGDSVLAVLPVAHRRVSIVMHFAAAGGSHLIKPPIVRGHVHVCAAIHQQFTRLPIEDHRVSADDALHERTPELRLLLKQLRKPNLVSSLVDQPRSRTVEQRNTGAPSFHDIDRTSQFVRLPYVILVAKSEVIAVETFCASHEKKVCRRPT